MGYLDEYYRLDRSITDPAAYVNSLYDRVLLNDQEAIGKVMEIMQAQGFKHVSYKLRGRNNPELVEEIVSEGLLRIYEKRLLNFEGGIEKPEYFYAHLIKFFDMVMLEQTGRAAKIQSRERSVQEMENSANESEHSSNDHTIRELADERSDPDRMAAEQEEKRVRQGQGEILRSLIAGTKSVPHEMISFCYSMILPSVLGSISRENQALKRCVQRAVAAAYHKVQEMEKANEALPENGAAVIFYEEYCRQIEALPWGNDYPYERFTFRSVVQPEVKYMHRVMKAKGSAAVKRERFLRELLEELPRVYTDEIDIERDSGRLSEAAGALMGMDTIGRMSGKFEDVYNHKDADTQNKGFVWGEAYKEGLKKGYTKYGHQIPEEGSLVYAEYFSHPLGGVPEKAGHDYLTENIRRYAERAQKSLVKEMTEVMRREKMLLERSAFMKEYSECRMKKIVREIGDRNGGMQR